MTLSGRPSVRRLCRILVSVGTIVWGSLPVAAWAVGDSDAPSTLAAQETASFKPNQPGSISQHRLTVELTPQSHRLKASDQMTVQLSGSAIDRLEFELAPTLNVTKVSARGNGQGLPLKVTRRQELSRELAGEPTQIVTIEFREPIGSQAVTMDWEYDGVIHDPPKEPRHLRFVTPSDTSGYIGLEGVYLSSESRWYPDRAGSIATFALRVAVPRGWTAVTHGRRLTPLDSEAGPAEAPVTEWEVNEPTEALTLVANQFVRTAREWKGEHGDPVLIETYLFPEEATLAQDYLDAAGRYLDVYSRLLGPYPFPKFAVVENFFPAGLGMPSFTLLGSGVIKRRYVQPYALGHEIVHSWIGNYVFNRPETGNWVEGLTTYLANYYYEELTGTPEQAREQRRLMLAGYAVYVPAEDDYAVAKFMRKTDQKDNAIGYQKAAMVFHMLRQEVGEEQFWKGLRTLVREYGGRYLDWRGIERLYAALTGRDLRRFFAQWIEQPGAPQLSLVQAVLARDPQGAGRSQHRLDVTIVQRGEPYGLTLPLAVSGEEGHQETISVKVGSSSDRVQVPLSFMPASVQLDPDYMVFRRIDRAVLPPMLNLFVTDRTRTVIVPPTTAREESSIYRRVVERLTTQEAADSQKVTTAVLPPEGADVGRSGGSVLFLGPTQRDAWRHASDPHCAARVQLDEARVAIDQSVVEGTNLAVLVSCPVKQAPGHVATLFYGMTPEAAGRVTRLLFFYGWQSYLIFRDGAVVARGDFGGDRESERLLVR